MSHAIGLDIGGTKIAAGIFDAQGKELAQIIQPTPMTYEGFLETCQTIVSQLEQKAGKAGSIGIAMPGHAKSGWICNSNLPHMSEKPLNQDLEKVLGRKVEMENDANCAALAEAIEGAGKGYDSVFGLIMGTGVGGGYVLNGRIISGANGLCGEIGHVPLPYYEESDGTLIECACGQKCAEKLIAGAGLARLYQSMTGHEADGKQITELAGKGDKEALRVLDCYYTVVAKAMVTILHSFDPDIITVSGGLNSLPGLYEEVPKRWSKYAASKNLVTKFVPATFGAIAGMRGAAILGRKAL